MTPTERQARELLPCPFCGQDVTDDEGCFKTGDVWEVRCGNPWCFAHDPGAESREEAVATWNRRAALTRPTQAGMVEVCADHGVIAVRGCAECDKDIAALSAMKPPDGGLPEGWVAVPVEATTEMLDAYNGIPMMAEDVMFQSRALAGLIPGVLTTDDLIHAMQKRDFCRRYAAMLAAAPKLDAQGGGE